MLSSAIGQLPLAQFAPSGRLLGSFYTELPAWLAPLWIVAVGVVLCALAMGAVYGGLCLVLPKVAAIARTTTKESWSQPLFWVEVALGIVLLLLFTVIPYNTFGEDIKVLKDSDLTLILVLAIVLAVWSASVSVASEIDGRTALTLLSKPISRTHFVLGKFTGIVGGVFSLFILLGTMFLVTVSYKVIYEARENALPYPTALQCQAEVLQIMPGLALAFMETVVLTAISVAISTRLPMLPNLVICSSIYVLGHLFPLIVNSRVGEENEFVRFFGLFITTVLPVLDSFNIQAAIATGTEVPLQYLGVAFVYCALLSAVYLLLALFFFEDRDLA